MIRKLKEVIHYYFCVTYRRKMLDKTIFQFNNLVTDGTIFQSNWSREKCYGKGMKNKGYEVVILNAPDKAIFNNIGRKEFNPENKIKLIATSWPANWRKGLEIYEYLDENLDFSNY